jgi:hypothetical protein
MVFACASMRIYDSDYQGCYLRVGHVVGTLHLRLYLYKLFCIFLLRMLDRFFIHRAASATLFSPQPHFCGRPSGLLFSLFSTSAPLSIKKRMPPKKSAAPEKKTLLGRPSNNLKIGIVGLFLYKHCLFLD